MNRCRRVGCQNEAAEGWIYCSLACQTAAAAEPEERPATEDKKPAEIDAGVTMSAGLREYLMYGGRG